MKKGISRRGKIRAVSYGTAVFCVLLIFAIAGQMRANTLSRQVRVSGERALCELDDNLDQIYTDLQKGLYATTPPMLGKLSEELSRSAAGAKTSLSVLPLSNAQMQNTYKFLSQVGHFVASLDKKLQRGDTLTQEEHEKMQQLLSFSRTLQEEISQMRTKLFDGYVDFKAENETISIENPPHILGDDLEDADQALTEYPTLIYDGPFSDHILQEDSAFLRGLEEISPETARTEAARILDTDAQNLEVLAEEDTTTAAYRFRTGDTVCAITKQGGRLLYLLSSAFAGESTLNEEDAIAHAQTFLTACGYGQMSPTYQSTADGICTVNFAYEDGDVLYYPDLIKVSVSLQDGRILCADCRGYLMHHKTRDLAPPKLSMQAAQSAVSPYLHVLDGRRAVIPTAGGKEQTTYEFHCVNHLSEEFLVYIDTETGYEDNILILLHADGGVLTK